MLTPPKKDLDYLINNDGERYFLLPSVALPEDVAGPTALLGQGEFGTVSIAMSEQLVPFAIKTIDIDKTKPNPEKQIAEIEKEFRIMRHLGWHVDMITPKDQPDTNKVRIYLLQPFVPGKSLNRYLESLKEAALLPENKDNEIAKLRILIQAVNSFVAACEATQLLHDRDVIHGDLHPGNFLYDVGKNKAKAIDFGMSHILPAGESKVYVEGDADVSNFHRAPETVTAQNLRPDHPPERVYDKSSDVFSLAITCGVISDFLDYAPDLAGKETAELMKLFKEMSQSEFLSGNSRPQDRLPLVLAIMRLKEIQQALDLRLAQKLIFDAAPQIKARAKQFKRNHSLISQTNELSLPENLYDDFITHSARVHSQENLPLQDKGKRAKAITTQQSSKTLAAGEQPKATPLAEKKKKNKTKL